MRVSDGSNGQSVGILDGQVKPLEVLVSGGSLADATGFNAKHARIVRGMMEVMKVAVFRSERVIEFMVSMGR